MLLDPNVTDKRAIVSFMNLPDKIKGITKHHEDGLLKYDYSEFVFTKMNIKGIIKCLKCSTSFPQIMTKHVIGRRGCPECNGTKKVTLHQFIKKANKIHDNLYTYDKAKYIGANKKLTVTCPTHGDFYKSPDNHLRRKQGCPTCAKINFGLNSRLTYDDFVRKSNGTHNHKYDYSLVDYQGNNRKVTIICPIHGKFSQLSSSHLKGCGCIECGKLKRANTQRFTTEEFIQKAKGVHGDTYDYSLVEYRGANKKVTIICFKHGEFQQDAITHLKGANCRDCMYEKQANTARFTLEDFISKAQEVHEGKYDYSYTKYEKSSNKVSITYPAHGEFQQVANKHLQGQGCMQCARELTSKDIYKDRQTTLYYVSLTSPEGLTAWKIGLTVESPEHRFYAEVSNGYTLTVIDTLDFIDGWIAFKLEQRTLKKFKSRRPYNNKFNPFLTMSGNTEVFDRDILKEYNHRLSGLYTDLLIKEVTCKR